MRVIRFALHVTLYVVYAGTCAITVAWRSLLVHLLLWLVGLRVFGPLVLIVAMLPILRGCCAFVAPLSPGPFFRWKHGLRKPSEREQTAIDAVLERIERPARLPKQVLVLDGPGTRAETIGATVVMERGLFGHWLPGALAHEIGHLNAATPAAQLALWWCHPQALLSTSENLRASPTDLDVEPAGLSRRLLAFLLRRFDGSNRFGDLLVRYFWPPILKRDVYASDRWATDKGFSDELVAFIEATDLPVDFSSPWPWLSTAPGAEKRLARVKLARLAERQGRLSPKLGAIWKTR